MQLPEFPLPSSIKPSGPFPTVAEMQAYVRAYAEVGLSASWAPGSHNAKRKWLLHMCRRLLARLKLNATILLHDLVQEFGLLNHIKFNCRCAAASP